MKDIVKPIAVLAAICLVVTALLATVNAVTSPIIRDANEKAAAKARQEYLFIITSLNSMASIY